MGPKDGVGKYVEPKGLFNKEVSGVVRIRNIPVLSILAEKEWLDEVVLQFKTPTILEGDLSLGKFKGTIALDISKLLSANPSKALLILRFLEEEYKITLNFVKIEDNEIIFSGESTLLGSITLALVLRTPQ